MHTFRYKGGYIHDNFTAGTVEYFVGDRWYPAVSVHAAKIRITRVCPHN